MATCQPDPGSRCLPSRTIVVRTTCGVDTESCRTAALVAPFAPIPQPPDRQLLALCAKVSAVSRPRPISPNRLLFFFPLRRTCPKRRRPKCQERHHHLGGNAWPKLPVAGKPSSPNSAADAILPLTTATRQRWGPCCQFAVVECPLLEPAGAKASCSAASAGAAQSMRRINARQAREGSALTPTAAQHS